MLINLTDVFSTEDKVVLMTVDYEKEAFNYQGESFLLQQKYPIELSLKNNGKGKAIIEGKVKLVFSLNCDRCLKEMKQTLDFSFARECCSPEWMKSETSKDEEEDKEFMEGFNVNADELISNEILINWPVKVLCKKDCKGICNLCGKDLNVEDCGCDTFVPDPRMAVIKDIFNANKEV